MSIVVKVSLSKLIEVLRMNGDSSLSSKKAPFIKIMHKYFNAIRIIRLLLEILVSFKQQCWHHQIDHYKCSHKPCNPHFCKSLWATIVFRLAGTLFFVLRAKLDILRKLSKFSFGSTGSYSANPRQPNSLYLPLPGYVM